MHNACSIAIYSYIRTLQICVNGGGETHITMTSIEHKHRSQCRIYVRGETRTPIGMCAGNKKLGKTTVPASLQHLSKNQQTWYYLTPLLVWKFGTRHGYGVTQRFNQKTILLQSIARAFEHPQRMQNIFNIQISLELHTNCLCPTFAG